LKDRMHDSAMSVNATTSIDSPCRRLVGSSTSRSRFRTQAHHLRQALVRYPFIHSEEIDLRLSPTETQLPPCGPDAESGTTWVHTAVGVYAPVRLHIVPPPSSLFNFIRPVARWDTELNRELRGQRGRRCVVKIRCSWPIPLTSSFVLKILHWLSSHIHQIPTTNGLELAVDDSRALQVLRRGFKNHCKDPELSSVSNARSGQVQCLPPCCARVSQSLGAHATFVLLLPYACSDLVSASLVFP
jgi:hypothetical protein